MFRNIKSHSFDDVDLLKFDYKTDHQPYFYDLQDIEQNI